MATSSTVRIAAVADLHYRKAATNEILPILSHASQEADMLILPGDLTDNGLLDEAELLARDIQGAVRVPVLAVLGNHDVHSGHEAEVREILTRAGILLLDGDAHEVSGIGIAGTKGFAGGFGKHALGPWGEEAIKRFVHEAVGEALKLESALAKLRTPHRVAVLHYAPVRSTVEGEPPEIFTYLGSSRLEEPLSRYRVTAVFHGHAHNGAAEGRTSRDAPVYNVSLPLLRRASPDRPFRIIEIPAAT